MNSRQESVESILASITLGGWSFYFLTKLLLYANELIDFHPLENIAFAIFLLIRPRNRFLQILKNGIALPLAIVLLYHDSWLPPFERVVSQAALIQEFSTTYLLELLQRFLNPKLLALLGLCFMAYLVIARFIRTGAIVIATMVAMVLGFPQLQEGGAVATAVAGPDINASAREADSMAGDPDAILSDFYEREAMRKVSFPQPQDPSPFDIIFIHVCSLSWADLKTVGLDSHPVWSSFDFLFTNFNSAASYSGPAAIRFNRATCGQTAHESLYHPTSEQCYLMPSLEKAGFKTNLALNHDGHFDNFLALVRSQGITGPMMPVDNLPIALRSFDNSPIYDDYAVLSSWLAQREKGGDKNAALFYNSISLHDGNRILSGQDAKLSSSNNYKPRLEKLLADITRFMAEIESRKRQAIVLIIPEHGAALAGDKMQISGLREIPLPSITAVPVGIRVIGKDISRLGGPVKLGEPSSYFTVATLLSRLLENSPFKSGGFSPSDYVGELPSTQHVAENEQSKVLQQNGVVFLEAGNEEWRRY